MNEQIIIIFLFFILSNLLYKHFNAHDFLKCFSLHKALAMHERVIKENYASICNGTWMCKVKAMSLCI
jgi:hypothetical protein